MRKYILFIGSCLLGLLLFCFWYFNTNVMFQRKFHFKLPKAVEIVSQSYSFYYDELGLKASFSADEYQMIIEGIKNYSKNNGFEVDVKSKAEMSLIRAYFNFWEEEKEEALFAYTSYIQGRWGVKTRMVCILITKDKENEGQYYLYVWY